MNKLAAWIGNDLIGHLAFDIGSGLFSFDYTTEWKTHPKSYAISPHLQFERTDEVAVHSRSVRCFFENLLPEGNALDAAASANGLAKSNLFGLIHVLGRENAGAIALLPEGERPDSTQAQLREITPDELSQRIRDRDHLPFNVWDGKVRLSIAGVQDKIAVYMQGEHMYLTEGGNSASTHILKPNPLRKGLETLVANEYFCMKLAAAINLKAAEVEIRRMPEPVLLIKRFDRQAGAANVLRRHIIDACQALDLPPAYKYERNFGNGKDVRHIRDGASFSKLFGLSQLSVQPAAFKMHLLRWTLFQYLIGNSDAHGKNISFHVSHDGIHPAPAYDLVSVITYNEFENEMAMGIADAFNFTDAMAFQWADFAQQCGLNKTLLARAMRRMATVTTKALVMPDPTLFTDNEKTIITQLKKYIRTQCNNLIKIAAEVPKVTDNSL
jgi:serine/threonine-protein kinase HipA